MSKENKCWRCLGWIQGEKVRFAEKEYHPHCYVCDMCKKSLKGLKIHDEGGKLYDETCFNNLQDQKCAYCKTIITRGGEIVKGKSYHTECFKCKGCNQALQGKSFYTDDFGYFYDEACFRDLNNYKCESCKGNIDGNGIEFTIFQGKYYHHNCFVCAQCNQSLAMQKFKMMLGQRYCSKCR